MDASSSLAPVAVFAYRRPDHLARTLDALAENHLAGDTDVTVFCDGPRAGDSSDETRAVGAVASEVRGFRRLRVIRRNENLGLASSIISGVGEMLAESDRVVVLEDDLVTSPAFLTFMNEGLNRFSEDDRVISIHGYAYPSCLERPFFLRGADCWGWATWRRGWNLLEQDGKALLDELRARNLTGLFDFNSTYPFTRMLEEQIAGEIDSWAIRWYASAFLSERLTLYPGKSLIKNIGNDGSGTHTGASSRFDAALACHSPALDRIRVKESKMARREFERFFSGETSRVCFRPNRLARRIAARLRKSLRRSG